MGWFWVVRCEERLWAVAQVVAMAVLISSTGDETSATVSTPTTTSCEVCPSSSTLIILTSVITAIITALLATVIFALTLIAVCKCHPKNTQGEAKMGASTGGEGQVYEQVDGGAGGVAVSDPTYMDVGAGAGAGGGRNTFQLQRNEAYGDIYCHTHNYY